MKTHSTTDQPLAENPQAVRIAKLTVSAVVAALQVAKHRNRKLFKKAGIEDFDGLARLLEASATAVLTEAIRDTNVYRLRGGKVAEITERRAAAADDARLVLAALEPAHHWRSPLYDVAEAHMNTSKEGGA